MAAKDAQTKRRSTTGRKSGTTRSGASSQSESTRAANTKASSATPKRTTAKREATTSKSAGVTKISQRQLQQVSQRFSKVAARVKDGDDVITVGEIGLTKASKLPKAAVDAMAAAMDLIAEGKHARVVVVPDEISTSQAAAILGISRPHFIGLLDAGHLPYRKSSDKETAHRYVKTDDVLDYQRRRMEAQAAMDEYGTISEELGV